MKPSDYPLGSTQSRAAARASLERRFAGRRRIDVVSCVPRPGGDGGIRIGTWIECDDGSLFRLSTVPPGMTIEEAERIDSHPGLEGDYPAFGAGRDVPPVKPELVKKIAADAHA